MEEKRNVVLEKSFELGLKIIIFTDELVLKNKVLANQILRSGTSVGANINEAQAALTKREFISILSISAREARETRYWLRLCFESKKMERDLELENLVDEIIRLLTSIIKKSQGNS